MRVYTLNNIDMVHIRTFAEVCGRSIQSTRYLIEQGNVIRKMKAFRDRSQLLIPITELKGYPFVKQGTAMGSKEVYHYVQVAEDKWEAQICPLCTYADKCEARKIADEAVIPQGDK